MRSRGSWRAPRSTGDRLRAGNTGTAQVGRNVAVKATDVDELVKLALREKAELVVIGPEDPLVLGLGDKLRAAGLRVFGTGSFGRAPRGLEGLRQGDPRPPPHPDRGLARFDRSGVAKSYLESCTSWPQVVKAEGLASGKGVFIVPTRKPAARPSTRSGEEDARRRRHAHRDRGSAWSARSPRARRSPTARRS
jgi:phosphoribosylamine--glycine ligase